MQGLPHTISSLKTHTSSNHACWHSINIYFLLWPPPQRYTCRKVELEYDIPPLACERFAARAAKLLNFLKKSSVYLTALASLLNSESSLCPPRPPVAIWPLPCNRFLLEWTGWACLVLLSQNHRVGRSVQKGLKFLRHLAHVIINEKKEGVYLLFQWLFWNNWPSLILGTPIRFTRTRCVIVDEKAISFSSIFMVRSSRGLCLRVKFQGGVKQQWKVN